jgi:hypothetical protein
MESMESMGSMGSYCVGIIINYSNGLQQPLGQCRPDARRHKVNNSFGFHHLSDVVFRSRKEIRKERVRLSTTLQEYQDLTKSGWESTKMNDEFKLTWLSWWHKDTYTFCDISYVKA